MKSPRLIARIARPSAHLCVFLAACGGRSELEADDLGLLAQTHDGGALTAPDASASGTDTGDGPTPVDASAPADAGSRATDAESGGPAPDAGETDSSDGGSTPPADPMAPCRSSIAAGANVFYWTISTPGFLAPAGPQTDTDVAVSGSATQLTVLAKTADITLDIGLPGGVMVGSFEISTRSGTPNTGNLLWGVGNVTYSCEIDEGNFAITQVALNGGERVQMLASFEFTTSDCRAFPEAGVTNQDIRGCIATQQPGGP